MSSKFTALGISIFAGGQTLGMSKHFKILAHFEETSYAVNTFKLNFPKVPVYINYVDWPVKQYHNKVDVCYSNPPCSCWSGVGRSMIHGNDNYKTDPRTQWTVHSFNMLEELNPTIWVWESVPRAYTAGRAFVDKLTKKAVRMGYSITYFFTNGAHHGLPQRRIRFHMIAHKVAINFDKPSYKYVTVAEALSNIHPSYNAAPAEDLGERYLRLARKTPQGGSLSATFNRLNPHPKLNDKGQVKGRPSFMRFRLDANKQSPTLIGGQHALHPYEDRYITPIEHAVLCGYPPDYKWADDANPYQQSAQAVTPIMGEYLGGIFKNALRHNKRIRKPLITIVDYRKGDIDESTTLS